MKTLNTPLVSIFCDNDDYYIPVVELDFFNRKGLHSHFKDDLKEWDIEKDYKELETKFKEELSYSKNEKTSNAILRKYTSTIPIEDNSKIPQFFKLNDDNTDLKIIHFDKLEFSEKLQSASIYQKLKKLALRDKIMDDLNLDLSKVIDYGDVLGFITHQDIESYQIEDVNVSDLDLQLMTSEYLIEFTGQEFEDSIFFKELNTGFIFKNSKKEAVEFINENPNVKFTIYRINNTNFMEITHEIANDNVNYDFTIIPQAIPNVNHKKLIKDDLKKLSKTNEVSLLKFKIDNLETIIDNLDSLEEKLAFTFYLELFMAGRINQITNKFKFYSEDFTLTDSFRKIELDSEDVIYKPVSKLPKKYRDLGSSSIHILHSSGDTLIAQGPKEDLIKFLKEFKLRFGKWSAFSDKFRFSATISNDDLKLFDNNVLIDDKVLNWKDLEN